ncbi:MAG TPA: methyltransferase [Flavilitoribacter sp.]|nr:methyltransferase [Flavilitoribacter sp.]HMQ87726.1 methyltransferase [Flavilitoribacter sp.]
MRGLFRMAMSRLYKPVLERYLRKDRTWRYNGFRMDIANSVFHPAFFGSSRVFAWFIKRQDLSGKTLLEIGCGSGLLSMVAAAGKAVVTAVDINEKAVECARQNAKINGLEMTVIHSDLFEKAPLQQFDLIICNPPYFPAEPKNPGAYAWYCEDDFGFFRRFFAAIPAFIHPHSRIWLILSEVCRLDAISAVAEEAGFRLKKILTEQSQFEIFIIFEAERNTA